MLWVVETSLGVHDWVVETAGLLQESPDGAS